MNVARLSEACSKAEKSLASMLTLLVNLRMSVSLGDTEGFDICRRAIEDKCNRIPYDGCVFSVRMEDLLAEASNSDSD